MCSQWAPNIQINYFIFDWSIYRLFVLNTIWEHDYLKMMIFVYVCSPSSLVEMKTLFETWIARSERKLCILISPFLFNNRFGAGHYN
jgi:hypothetical protein